MLMNLSWFWFIWAGSLLVRNLIPCQGVTHWGRVTHICVGKLTIIGSDNGLSPGRRQAIIWNNAILLIGHLGTNFSEILIEIHTFSFKKMDLKMSSGKWRPSCLGLNVVRNDCYCFWAAEGPVGNLMVMWWFHLYWTCWTWFHSCVNHWFDCCYKFCQRCDHTCVEFCFIHVSIVFLFDCCYKFHQ